MAKKIRKSRKSTNKRETLTRLEQLPNVGPKIARLLRRLGVKVPQDLRGHDAYQMYQQLCRLSGARHDPCVLDVFISAVEFMRNGVPKPWWKFTAQRKRRLKSCE